MRRTTNRDAQRWDHVRSGLARRTGYFLAVVQSVSLTYCLCAVFVSAFTLFVLLSSAFGGGAPAISLPVGASEATEVPSLQSGMKIADAHFTELVFSAWGLSPMAALLYYAPGILLPLGHALIALAIYKLAVSAGSPRPFGRSARRALTLCAVTIAAIGTATQLLHGLGTSLARSELLRDTEFYAGRVMPTPFDWSPIFIGLAVGILVLVFNAGERFQEETDGLV